MSSYTHILLAMDFSPDSERVAQQALDLSRHYQARLSLIHVVEYLPVDMGNELLLPQDPLLETQLVDGASARLAELAAGMGMDDAPRHVLLGHTRHEILRVAEEQKIDLIVLGSHGRHGLQRLLGSTANAVLHGAPCDVLAVRIREE